MFSKIVIILYCVIFSSFFLREFQLMASAPDDQPRHQSVFGVGRD